VVDGALVEDQLDLGNRGTHAATSVHAYSPPGLPLRFGLAGAASPAAAELLGAAR